MGKTKCTMTLCLSLEIERLFSMDPSKNKKMEGRDVYIVFVSSMP